MGQHEDDASEAMEWEWQERMKALRASKKSILALQARTSAEALSQRAKVTKRWEWRDGMLAFLKGDAASWRLIRPCPDTGSGEKWHAVKIDTDDTLEAQDIWVAAYLPDLTDPGTEGAVLDLLQDAWPEAHLGQFTTNVFVPGPPVTTEPAVWWRLLGPLSQPYEVLGWGGAGVAYLAGATKPEALVAALEAA